MTPMVAAALEPWETRTYIAMMMLHDDLPPCFAARRIRDDRWEIVTTEIEDDHYPVLARAILDEDPENVERRSARNASKLRKPVDRRKSR
jgi:hypothetical protein